MGHSDVPASCIGIVLFDYGYRRDNKTFREGKTRIGCILYCMFDYSKYRLLYRSFGVWDFYEWNVDCCF